MEPRRDNELFEMMCDIVRTQAASIRGQERVISCLKCGEVLATYRVEEDEHVCPRT